MSLIYVSELENWSQPSSSSTLTSLLLVIIRISLLTISQQRIYLETVSVHVSLNLSGILYFAIKLQENLCYFGLLDHINEPIYIKGHIVDPAIMHNHYGIKDICIYPPTVFNHDPVTFKLPHLLSKPIYAICQLPGWHSINLDCLQTTLAVKILWHMPINR